MNKRYGGPRSIFAKMELLHHIDPISTFLDFTVDIFDNLQIHVPGYGYSLVTDDNYLDYTLSVSAVDSNSPESGSLGGGSRTLSGHYGSSFDSSRFGLASCRVSSNSPI